MNYLVKDFETEYKTPEGFFQNDIVIIDNEIQNDISPNWDYETGKISVVGILLGTQIMMFVAENEDDIDFKTEVRYQLEKLKHSKMFYAFNNKMEMGNFKGYMAYDLEIQEIKPFNAKGWNKDRFYNTLKDRKVIPDIEIKDVFKGDAGLCVTKWQEYIKTKDEQHLMDIVSHNINCLLKESVIYKNRQYFLDNWDIDGNGFMLNEKRK